MTRNRLLILAFAAAIIAATALLIQREAWVRHTVETRNATLQRELAACRAAALRNQRDPEVLCAAIIAEAAP